MKNAINKALQNFKSIVSECKAGRSLRIATFTAMAFTASVAQAQDTPVENNNDSKEYVISQNPLVQKMADIIEAKGDSIREGNNRFMLTQMVSDGLITKDEYNEIANDIDLFRLHLNDELVSREFYAYDITEAMESEVKSIFDVLQDPDHASNYVNDFQNDYLGPQTTFWAMFQHAKMNGSDMIPGDDRTWGNGFAQAVQADDNVDNNVTLNNIEEKIALERLTYTGDEKCNDPYLFAFLIKEFCQARDYAHGKTTKLFAEDGHKLYGAENQAKLINQSLEDMYADLSARFSNARGLSNLTTSLAPNGVLNNALNLGDNVSPNDDAVAQIAAMMAMEYGPYASYLLIKHAHDPEALNSPISEIDQTPECIKNKF